MISEKYFGHLTNRQWLLLSCLFGLNIIRVVGETIVFLRDMTCTLHGHVFIECGDGVWFGKRPIADFLLTFIQVIHYLVLFALFWYWNVWFAGTACEVRFHLNPTQLIHSRKTFKKLYVKQLTVFEFFSMWLAGVAFLFLICTAEGSDWFHYAVPLGMSLAMFVEIFAIVPMNFSAPSKTGPARYMWFFTLFSVVYASALSTVFFSLLVALKVYDPSFISSIGVHALILVLGTMVVNLRLSVFYMVRRKMWNPKANSIMPNLKSVQGHFQDQVNGDLTDAFLYASRERVRLVDDSAGGDKYFHHVGTGSKELKEGSIGAPRYDDDLRAEEDNHEKKMHMMKMHGANNVAERYTSLC